ncbi:MAG: hypothetical protein JSS07_08790 [Proteobacteria bacterium]|nr:hypothetical protein [Pseudomonadota bacterium]
MKEIDNINKVLERQLIREGLSIEFLPTNLKSWQKFITRINNHYSDIEQERYILERSSEIASQESMALNKEIERSQQIANIGRWSYDYKNNIFRLSKELFQMFRLNSEINFNTLDHFKKNILKEDIEKFSKTIQNAIDTKADTECEIRCSMSLLKYYGFTLYVTPFLIKAVVVMRLLASPWKYQRKKKLIKELKI